MSSKKDNYLMHHIMQLQVLGTVEWQYKAVDVL